MGRDGIIRDGSNRRANSVTNAGENLDLSSVKLWPRHKRDRLEQMDGWQRAEEVEIWDSSAHTQSCQTNITSTFSAEILSGLSAQHSTTCQAIFSLPLLSRAEIRVVTFCYDNKPGWLQYWETTSLDKNVFWDASINQRSELCSFLWLVIIRLDAEKPEVGFPLSTA